MVGRGWWCGQHCVAALPGWCPIATRQPLACCLTLLVLLLLVLLLLMVLGMALLTRDSCLLVLQFLHRQDRILTTHSVTHLMCIADSGEWLSCTQLLYLVTRCGQIGPAG